MPHRPAPGHVWPVECRRTVDMIPHVRAFGQASMGMGMGMGQGCHARCSAGVVLWQGDTITVKLTIAGGTRFA